MEQSTRVCSVQGCEKPIFARTWCGMHYKRWNKYGSFELPEQAPPQWCSIQGCRELVQARGWCQMHYARWQRHGSTADPIIPEPRICSIPECGKPHRSRGLCSTHYARWLAYGNSFDRGSPIRIRTCYESLADALWDRVERTDGCWLWQGLCYEEGYGRFRYDNTDYSTHRVAWELTNGPIPDGLCVLHDCDRNYPPGDISYRACCRPDHLFLGTNDDNMADMVGKQRQVHGENQHNAKLTEDKVRAIRAKHRIGYSLAELAREYRISPPSIAKVVYRETWKHVD